MVMDADIYHLPSDKCAHEAGCYLDLTYPRSIAEWTTKHLRLSTDCFGGKAGQPVTLLPHQQKILNSALGWRNPDSSLRIKRVNIWQPRRSGKTMLCAILSTVALLQGTGREIVNLASTVDQAGALFNQVADFIRFNGEQLGTHKYFFCGHSFWIRKHLKTIEVTDTNSTLKILAASNRGIAGRGLSLCILDEISQFPKAYVQDTWDYLQDSGASVPNSQLWTISTPSTDFSHLWRTTIYKKTTDILQGADDDITTLPVDFAMPESVFGQGPEDENWKGFDYIPGAGLTVPKKYYVQEWAACRQDPVECVRYKIMNCCQHMSSPTIWIDEQSWQNCYENFKESDLYHSKNGSVFGVDFGSAFDLSAIVVLVQRGDKVYLCPRFFIPKYIADKRTKSDHFAYFHHAADPANNIYMCDDDVVPGPTIVERVKFDKSLFGFERGFYDKTRLEIVRQEIEKHTRIEMVGVTSTAPTMSQLYQHFKSLVKQRKLVHNNNPLMNYCLRNCRPKETPKGIILEQPSEYAKNDGVTAACLALSHFFDEVEIKKPPVRKYAAVWS